jgi:hypothetical protein
MSFLCGSFSVLGSGVQVYPVAAFNEQSEAGVILIEVPSDENGGSRRQVVTEDLIETYIEKDFGVIQPTLYIWWFDAKVIF